MPEKIQRQPRGLLGLLGIKSLGIAPDRLADEVRPVLRMEELYLNERRISTSSLSPGTQCSAGSKATITVPTTEAWFIKEIGAEVTNWQTVPTDVCFVAVRHQQEPNNNLSPTIHSAGPFNVASTTDLFYSGRVFDEPLFANPGDVFFLYNLKLLQDSVPATVIAIFALKIRYTPIPF